MWTEQEAQQKLTEVLPRANAGEAQFVGECGVRIPRGEYERLKAIEAEEAHPWVTKSRGYRANGAPPLRQWGEN